MINPNVLYHVTGRYMDGQKLDSYHLVGEDGSQAQESKERIIHLITKGVITNMRLQVGEDKELIIRGKGVNLNNLPVYDVKKQKFRDNNISQSAANSGVNVNKNIDSVNPMGQYRILRRIMYKTTCLGYELQDYSGAIIRKDRKKTIDLAVQRLISNATANKYVDKNTGETRITLRGVNCEIKKLPMLIVNEQGKIVDPKADKSTLTVRSVYLKHAGIIKELSTNKYKQFKAGDFVICYPDGTLGIQNSIYINKYYKPDRERNSATCDDYLDNTNNYAIEMFGGKPVVLNPNIIKSWAILKPSNNA